MTIPTLAKVAALFGLVLAMTAGFFLFVRNWSGRTGDSREEASEMLTKFRELHTRGGLSDAEYRTIKTKLAPDLGADTFSSIEESAATIKGDASNNRSINDSLPKPASSALVEEDWLEEGDSEA